MNATDVVPIYLRVDPSDIGLIKFVVESYEGVAIVRTVDRKAAVIVLLAVPDSVGDVRGILDSIAPLARWEEVAAPVDSDDWLMRWEGQELKRET
jgi:hypothetical protein